MDCNHCTAFRVSRGALVNVVSDDDPVILEILASLATSFLILAICLISVTLMILGIFCPLVI